MARWFAFALVVALFCIFAIQAAPVQEETNANKVEDVVNKAVETFNKGLQDIRNDPGLNKFLKETQEFFQTAAEKIKEGAQKMIPKTEGTAETA